EGVQARNPLRSKYPRPPPRSRRDLPSQRPGAGRPALAGERLAARSELSAHSRASGRVFREARPTGGGGVPPAAGGPGALTPAVRRARSAPRSAGFFGAARNLGKERRPSPGRNSPY